MSIIIGACTKDVAPPIISHVTVSEISSNSANISWTTDEAATSQIEYGKTVQYGASTPVDETLTASHTVLLSGLTPNTSYQFRIKSRDKYNNESVSHNFSLTTRPIVWSDGRVEVVVDMLYRSGVFPPALIKKWPDVINYTLKPGYDLVIIYINFIRVQEGYVLIHDDLLNDKIISFSMLNQGSIIRDSRGIKYDCFCNIELPADNSETPMSSIWTLVSGLPKNEEPTKLTISYSFGETAEDSDRYWYELDVDLDEYK